MFFYHNVTKNQYNETDLSDLFDNIEPRDVVLRTESGDAIVIRLTLDQLEKLEKDHVDFLAAELADNKYPDNADAEKWLAYRNEIRDNFIRKFS